MILHTKTAPYVRSCFSFAAVRRFDAAAYPPSVEHAGVDQHAEDAADDHADDHQYQSAFGTADADRAHHDARDGARGAADALNEPHDAEDQSDQAEQREKRIDGDQNARRDGKALRVAVLIDRDPETDVGKDRPEIRRPGLQRLLVLA